MVIYHGTRYRHWLDIQKNGVSAAINWKNQLDYGYGFYLSDRIFATKMAIARYEQALAEKNYDPILDAPVVIEFQFDDKQFENYQGLVIRRKGLRFLRIVWTCRLNVGTDTLHVDYVNGPVADGNVDNVVAYYLARKTWLRKAIGSVHFMIPIKHRQIVLKNQTICDTLKVERVYTIEGGVLYEKGSSDPDGKSDSRYL